MRLPMIFALCMVFAVTAFAGEGDDRYCDPCLDIDASIVPGTTWQTVAGNTAGQPNSEYAYSFCALQGGSYTFTFFMQGGSASFDTALSVQGPDVCGPYIVCNDDFCGLQSEVQFFAPASATYIVVVDGYSSAAGSYVLAYSGPDGASPVENANWGEIKGMFR